MTPERFSDFLCRRRGALAAVWVLHATALHLVFLGLISWDAFWYRGTPIVELIKHGRYNFDSFPFWVFAAYTPFAELPHVPFVWAFGLPGFIIGYPLVVFPLCLWAIWLFVREVTDGDRYACTFGTLAYAAIPMINQQPFSAYIDFIVVGLLAFFVHAVLRLRTMPVTLRRPGGVVRLALASFALSMSRVHGIYMIALFTPALVYVAFLERAGLRVRVNRPAGLRAALIGLALGAAPVAAQHVERFVRYRSPIYPYQFRVFGIGTKAGVPMHAYVGGGVKDESLRTYVHGFVSGWIWPDSWDNFSFFDGRYLGGGLVFVLGLALLPLFVRRASRVERWIAATCLLSTILARDYVLPRYSYGLILALVLVYGRALAALATAARHRFLFWIPATLLLLHLLRPEGDMAMILHGNGPRPRLNVTRSRLFLHQPVPDGYEIEPYPDVGAKLTAIETVGNGFYLPLYGARLTNEIMPTIKKDAIGERCAKLRPLAEVPGALFVDDLNEMKDCDRECAFGIPNWCQAWRLKVP